MSVRRSPWERRLRRWRRRIARDRRRLRRRLLLRSKRVRRFFATHHRSEQFALGLAGVLFVLTAISATAGYDRSVRAHRYVVAGDSALSAEDYPAARIAYARALEVAPHLGGIQTKLGLAGELDGSHRHLIAGMQAYNTKRFEVAIREFTLVDRRDPAYPFARGVIDQSKSQAQTEQKTLRAFDGYLAASQAAYGRRDYRSAISSADQGLALLNPDYHFDHAKIDSLEAKRDAAKAALFALSSQKSPGAGSLRVPILMYHYIRVNPDPADSTGYGLSVTPSDFDAQMGYLASQGYHPIDMGQLVAALKNHTGLPDRPVVITFDDGYADFYTAAYPILRKYGLHGEAYIISGLIGDRYMSWDQIREVRASGLVTIGSHTVHHAYLPGLSDQALRDELTQSKQTIESQIGSTVSDFCYPYGSFNSRVAGAAAAAGYTNATSTVEGYYHPSGSYYDITRVRVSGGEDLATFARRL